MMMSMMSSLRLTANTTAWLSVAVLLIGTVAGCASSAPPPPPAPTAASFHGMRRVVIVPGGESRFAVVEPGEDPNRIFAEIFKWVPNKHYMIWIAQAVYQGLTSLIESGRAAGTAPKDVTPGTVVAGVLAKNLRLTGPFDQVVTMEREPVGDARQDTDAIVRLAVPNWGLVRVREGQPALVAAFADVRAQLVARETGVVLWEHEQDVTHPDRRSLDVLTKDRALTRDSLIEVLERAGRRLANELVYAQRGER